jgi:DNA-binding LytR/AlgR family response regulator
LVLLPLEQVLAFESESRLTFVHADDGRYDIDLSLAVLEKLLPNDVLRVARNWLVNPRHVRAIDRHDGQLVLEVGGKGLRVPVARERNQRLRELLLRDGLGLRQR